MPWASVCVHVTVTLTPSENMLPEAGMQDEEPEPSTASVQVGAVYVTTAPEGPVASGVMSLIGAMTGLVLS